MSHQWAAIAFAALGIVLVVRASGSGETVAAAIYAASIVALFVSSAIYHRVTWRSPASRQRMRRVDHSMIFVLIAGSYTPFAAVSVGGLEGALILAAVWLSAALGILSTIWWVDLPRWVTAGCYLAMGWIAIPLAPLLWDEIGPEPLALVGTGGLLYTLGAVAYARKAPNPLPGTFGYHEVFHILVIAAAGLQFAAVAFWVV